MAMIDEIMSMMDYLGMDAFPQDGYVGHAQSLSYHGEFIDFSSYKGKYIDEYDGYQVGIVLKKKDNQKGYSLEAKRHKPRKGSGRRNPNELFSVHDESDDDPPPVEINDEDDDGLDVLEAIHRNLVRMCRKKAYDDLVNEEMDLHEMPWCKR